MVTPIAFINCWSIIENALLFHLAFTKGDTFMPSSPVAVSRSRILIMLSKFSLISPNHHAHIDIPCPQRNCCCGVSNGPLMPLFPSPTTSAANSPSSVLNFLLYKLSIILGINEREDGMPCHCSLVFPVQILCHCLWLGVFQHIMGPVHAHLLPAPDVWCWRLGLSCASSYTNTKHLSWCVWQ